MSLIIRIITITISKLCSINITAKSEAPAVIGWTMIGESWALNEVS